MYNHCEHTVTSRASGAVRPELIVAKCQQKIQRDRFLVSRRYL
jgi:hypothetical protein